MLRLHLQGKGAVAEALQGCPSRQQPLKLPPALTVCVNTQESNGRSVRWPVLEFS